MLCTPHAERLEQQEVLAVVFESVLLVDLGSLLLSFFSSSFMHLLVRSPSLSLNLLAADRAGLNPFHGVLVFDLDDVLPRGL